MYRPRFLSVSREGERIWAAKGGAPPGSACDTLARYAKALLTVGDPSGDPTALEPAGHALELLPLAGPNDVGPGGKVLLRLLFQGEPLASARVEGVCSGCPQGAPASFSGRTDRNGEVLAPAPAGLWAFKAFHSRPYPDPALCDLERFEAILSFKVKG
jgi:uncharacterized GH25 family protein